MSVAPITFLLNRLAQLMENHYSLMSGAEKELETLKSNLETLKSFLADASEAKRKDNRFKDWERLVREAVNEIRDTIDSCISQENNSVIPDMLNPKRIIPNMLIPKKCKLAKRVKSLLESTVKPLLNADIVRGPFAGTSGETNERIKKEPRGDNVVALDEPANTLIGYLMEESEFEVLSIIGMPGLGKTTLAWKIHKDTRIKNKFNNNVIWVSVSQEFSKKEVLLTILRNFNDKDTSDKSDEVLSQEVKKYLERAKFLIVLDDVWTTELWEGIHDVFTRNNRMGKVLITSRDEHVANHANKKRKPYKLKHLEPFDSWQLLQYEVFGEVDKCDPDLEAVGKVIADKCGGLPYGLVVMGGILVGKRSTERGNMSLQNEWEKVCESVQTNIIHDKNGGMERIIKLSYDSLPTELRDCFLYLGMFPEDSEIPVWKSIQLWIAEGFIIESDGNTVEQIALDKMMDLIKKNLLMVDKMKADGEVKTCKVHDTIREFCKKEARVQGNNLFQEIRKSKEGTFPLKDIQGCRRLCIHSYVLDFLMQLPEGLDTRTFVCFSKEPIRMESKNVPKITNALAIDLLKVLDILTIKFPKFPVKFTQLIHLRYITLSCNELKVLPTSISNLLSVETLIVETLSPTLEIKADIWKMTQLRHLKTKASIILNQNGKGNLFPKKRKGKGGENLRTLSNISPQSCTDDVFEKAKYLHTLGIRGDIYMLVESNCLQTLGRLEKLKLVYDVSPKVASENPLRSLPQHNKFPSNLKTLILSATYLDWKDMGTVGRIGNLEILKLKENAFKGDRWATENSGFIYLKLLCIGVSDLRLWTAPKGSFPKLKNLILKDCRKLEEVPSEFGKKLDMLQMDGVSKFAISSAKLMEEQHRDRGFKLVIASGNE